MRPAALALALVALAACGPPAPPVRTTGEWPTELGDYRAVTVAWTRRAVLRGQYQEVLELVATFKSPDWRAAHAAREADYRGLNSDARAQRMAQAKADWEGPYEVQMMVTTWDRRENDLDKGKRSVWHVVLVDDAGNEIEPLEIVKDKRPAFTVRAEFPGLGDFATAYVARFPRTTPLFGRDIRAVRLRMSSERGGVELVWSSL